VTEVVPLGLRAQARSPGWLRSRLANAIQSGAQVHVVFSRDTPCAADPPCGTVFALGDGVVQRELKLSPLGIHVELRAGGQWCYVRCPWWAIRSWRVVRNS